MPNDTLVYVGTYTEPIRFGTGHILEGRGEGIHIFRMDPSTGALTPHSTTAGVRNPSYLAFHPSRRFLYAVNELKEHEGRFGGSVSAFAVDDRMGTLELLNRQPTDGTDPCHVAVHDSGKLLFVSNFMSGSVCVLPVREDGTLGEATDLVQHQGSGTDPVRQSGPHAHGLTLDPSGRLAFVPDLGIDRLMIYRVDPERGRLIPHDPPWVDTKPGAGPRHFVFHPDGRKAYLINELDSTLTAFEFDPGRGALREVQTVPTLPEEARGPSTCADVNVAPSGQFVYGSNRGHNSIVIYRIDPESGRLHYVGHESTRGRTPRNFTIDPTGGFLLAANQDSGTIVAFRLDPQTGHPRPTGQVTEVGTPVCVKVTLR